MSNVQIHDSNVQIHDSNVQIHDSMKINDDEFFEVLKQFPEANINITHDLQQTTANKIGTFTVPSQQDLSDRNSMSNIVLKNSKGWCGIAAVVNAGPLRTNAEEECALRAKLVSAITTYKLAYKTGVLIASGEIIKERNKTEQEKKKAEIARADQNKAENKEAEALHLMEVKDALLLSQKKNLDQAAALEKKLTNEKTALETQLSEKTTQLTLSETRLKENDIKIKELQQSIDEKDMQLTAEINNSSTVTQQLAAKTSELADTILKGEEREVELLATQWSLQNQLDETKEKLKLTEQQLHDTYFQRIRSWMRA